MIQPFFMNPSLLKERRRLLRKNPTKTEEFLWEHIKNSSLGVKFSRQVGIGTFIVDFCCRSQKLIVEVDGEIHDKLENVVCDNKREDILKSLDYRILRFKNKEVLENLNYVITTIKNNLSPLPTPGEGLGGGGL